MKTLTTTPSNGHHWIYEVDTPEATPGVDTTEFSWNKPLAGTLTVKNQTQLRSLLSEGPLELNGVSWFEKDPLLPNYLRFKHSYMGAIPCVVANPRAFYVGLQESNYYRTGPTKPAFIFVHKDDLHPQVIASPSGYTPVIESTARPVELLFELISKFYPTFRYKPEDSKIFIPNDEIVLGTILDKLEICIWNSTGNRLESVPVVPVTDEPTGFVIPYYTPEQLAKWGIRALIQTVATHTGNTYLLLGALNCEATKSFFKSPLAAHPLFAPAEFIKKFSIDVCLYLSGTAVPFDKLNWKEISALHKDTYQPLKLVTSERNTLPLRCTINLPHITSSIFADSEPILFSEYSRKGYLVSKEQVKTHFSR